MKNSFSRPIREVFLTEALGHVSAADVCRPGEVRILLPVGSPVDPKTIADLAAAGIDRLQVHAKPRLALVVIGNGLQAPGLPLLPGKSYDAVLPALRAALEAMHIRAEFLRRLAPDGKMLRRLLPFALGVSDILLVACKQSPPSADGIRAFIPGVAIVDAEGPALEALPRGKLVFLLPYDPLRVLDGFYRHVQPAILRFMGYAGPLKPVFSAV
jgi:molybdopterin biosynthesis enzyme